MGDGRFVAYCVMKIQNKLKHNFSGRVSLLQAATVTGISSNWFENFQRFDLWRVIFPGIFSHGSRETTTGLSYREVQETEGSRTVIGTLLCW